VDPDPAEVTPPDATRRALDALDRAVHLLDRGLAPRQKVRAFRRAAEVVGELGSDELEERTSRGTLTELEGIGASTGSVITAAVTGGPSAYLDELDRSTTIPVHEGAELRAALRGDCHLHTTWSDGGASIADMARTAAALGHEYLVVTDHSPRLTIAHGLSAERLAQQLDEIERVRAEVPVRILTGIEVDILEDGTLDHPDEILERLDVVVASVHSKLSMPADRMTRRMVLAVANPHVDILGHCTGRQIVGTPRPPSSFDAEVVFAACARFDTAVEINCRPERMDPPDELLALAVEWGCRFSIDTDAHATGQLEWQALGCDKAARVGVDPDDVVNTWDAERLLAWTAAHPTG